MLNIFPPSNLVRDFISSLLNIFSSTTVFLDKLYIILQSQAPARYFMGFIQPPINNGAPLKLYSELTHYFLINTFLPLLDLS